MLKKTLTKRVVEVMKHVANLKIEECKLRKSLNAPIGNFVAFLTVVMNRKDQP